MPSFFSWKFMLYDARNFLRNLKLWPQESSETPDPLTSLKEKIDQANKNFFSLEQILQVGLIQQDQIKLKVG